MTMLALGPFLLDTRDDLLYRDGEPIPLGRRAAALLRALVERAGTLVSKDALIEAAWPDQTVEESNLTVQISSLRRILSAVPGGETWIETMPRRGYRLTAPIAEAAAQDAMPAPEPSPPAVAERRQITALSCELIGMAGRTDDAGLEDLRVAVRDFRRCVAEAADRHGGLPISFLGHAALVLFGYPAASEHDAEHAVRAGLTLCAVVRSLRLNAAARPQCRVGIATGIAIVDLPDSGGDREIVGDAPDLAAQLRLSAYPGVVAIERATRRLIGGLFDCREIGMADSFGGPERLPVWKVLGESLVTSRFEALRGPALSSLVGRDEEVGLLLRLWARAMAGEGQIALVSGEAGLGKSRLVAALEERLDRGAYFRLRYFCSPHHQDSPLFPIIDQFAHAAGFGRDDTPAARSEKLQALLAGADLPDADVALLADLLALPLPEGHALPQISPAAKRQRTLEALIRQIEGLARQLPVIMVVEDAHWLDATSHELLDLIVERARELNLLLIVTFRPEFQPPWIGQMRVTLLALNRLDRRDRITLAAQVAGKALPTAVIEQIADRTDGVPLFVEELTKTVLESGLLRAEPDRYILDGALPPLAIPTSLYASLLARLDRSKPARLVAQTGAAIGREFPYELLRAVSSISEEELQTELGRLVDSELVSRRGTPPQTVYSFKHALVRDAAYGSLLRDPRRALHARIAEALSEQSPMLLETQPELFAQHYAAAGMIEPAVAAWAKAGRRSAGRSALAEAAVQFQKALEQLALLPDTADRARQELELHSALGASLRFVKGQAAPETSEAYARACLLWEQLGSPLAFAHVPYGQSMVHVYRGELEQARRGGEELLRLSRERADSAALVLGHSVSGQSLMLAGDFAGARPHLEQVLETFDPLAHAGLVQQAGSHPLMTQAFLGLTLFCLGFPEQAGARIRAAITDARRLAHPTSLAVSLAIGALQASLAGDWAALGGRADELTAVATEQGLPFYRAWGTIFRGRAKVQEGDVADGVALLRAGVAAYRDTGAVMWLPHFIALLAEGCAAAGQAEEAGTLLDDAIRIVERTGERWFLAELHRNKEEARLQQGLAEADTEPFRNAVGVARQQQARLWELRAATSLARLRSTQERRGEARDALAPIYGRFTEGADTLDLAAAKALLDGIEP